MKKITGITLALFLSILSITPMMAQDEPQSNKDKIEALGEEMKRIGELIDSLSENIESEVEQELEKEFEKEGLKWEEDKLKIDLDRESSDKLTSFYSVVSLGSTFLFDDEVSEAETPDFKPFRSWSGQLGFSFLTRFGQSSNVGLEYGMVYRFTELDNRDDYLFVEVADDEYAYEKQSIELKQSELYSHYLTIPVSLRFNDRANDKFSVSVGGYAGLKLGGSQEIKTDIDGRKQKIKTRDDYGLSDFQYGLSLGIGGSSVQWYSTYELSNFFESKDTYKWNVATTGIRLMF
jgi:hypothetical protein